MLHPSIKLPGNLQITQPAMVRMSLKGVLPGVTSLRLHRHADTLVCSQNRPPRKCLGSGPSGYSPSWVSLCLSSLCGDSQSRPAPGGVVSHVPPGCNCAPTVTPGCNLHLLLGPAAPSLYTWTSPLLQVACTWDAPPNLTPCPLRLYLITDPAFPATPKHQFSL